MRPFDHVVLPVADLVKARARYQALGFTVAPDGVHPFGTANCCVFLADGSFLEPLALVDAQARDAALADTDNAAFVLGHESYTKCAALEGFSHLVLRSDDGDADAASFEKAKILSGKTHFQRTTGNGLGGSQKVAFDLTFATENKSPLAGFFTCHSLLPAEIDFSPLREHANGVTGVSHIFTTSDVPHSHWALVEAFVGTTPDAGEDYLSLDLGQTNWTIETPARLADNLNVSLENLTPLSAGMVHRAIRFGGARLEDLANQLEANGVPFSQVKQALVVPPGPGQGFWVVFGPDG